jgi:hypothetical protein
LPFCSENDIRVYSKGIWYSRIKVGRNRRVREKHFLFPITEMRVKTPNIGFYSFRIILWRFISPVSCISILFFFIAE